MNNVQAVMSGIEKKYSIISFSRQSIDEQMRLLRPYLEYRKVVGEKLMNATGEYETNLMQIISHTDRCISDIIGANFNAE
jgi:hypothetical protein